MKCGLYVLRSKRAKLRKDGSYSWSVTNYFHKATLEANGQKLPNPKESQKLERCDGNIIALVETHISGGCSCCGDAELEVEYKCTSCGFSGEYPQLPSRWNLSDWLTKYVAELPEVK